MQHGAACRSPVSHKQNTGSTIESRTVLSWPSTPPSSPLMYLTFSTPFILYSSVTEWETERSTSPLINTRQRTPAAGSQRTTHSPPLWWAQSSGLIVVTVQPWQSNYVLEFSRYRLNPLVTMVGKRRTHELLAWFSSLLSIFSLTHAPPPSHSHACREMKIQLQRIVVMLWWTHGVITHQIQAMQVAHR